MTEEDDSQEKQFEPQIVNEVTRHLLNPAQNEILKKLTRLFGDLAGQLYSDICRMAGNSGQDYHAQRHLIAHLMRETEGLIRTFLLNLVTFICSEKLKDEKQNETVLGNLFSILLEKDTQKLNWKELENYLKGHKKQIRFINAVFELDENSPLFQTWNKLITEADGYNALHGETHLNRSANARVMTALFREMVELFDTWLQSVIKAVEIKYDSYLIQLEEIKSKPTPENAKLFCSLPKAQIIQNYFFKDNQNSSWLPLLEKESYFEILPSEAIKADDNETLHGGWWPAGQYLTRMARISDKAAERVVEITKGIKWKENNIVIHDIINIAVALPDKYSLQLSEIIIDIFSHDNLNINRIFLRDAIDVAEKWFKAGEIDLTARLSSLILKTHIDEKDKDIHALFGDDYFYNEAVKNTEKLFNGSSPSVSFKMFTAVLDNALKQKYGSANKDEKERLFHSRGEIDNSGTHYTDKILNALITAVQDSFLKIMESGTLQEIKEAFNLLNTSEWHIFRRIKFSVSSKHIEKSKDYIIDEFLNLENFKDGYLDSEYKDLASSVVPFLDDTQKEILIGYLDTGYDLDKIKGIHSFRHNGEEPSEEELQKLINRWKRNKLIGWVASLPEEWKEKNKNLVDEFSISPRRKNIITSYTRWGSVSPITPEDLKNLPSNEIVPYLKTWKATSFSFDDPTVEGLEQSLKEAVKLEPNKFSALAKDFIELPPYYISRLLAGLHEVEDKPNLDWDSIISLIDYVSGQEDEEETEESSNTEWYWAKNNAADLLATVLTKDKKNLLVKFIDKAYDVLTKIAESRDYQIDKDKDSDGYGKAINTMRGRAVEILIRFVLRIKRLEKEGDVSLMPFIPKVFDKLTNSVNPKLDGSSATRSIMGVLFPWLNLANPDWTKKHLLEIFKSPVSKDEAWKAFINHTDPYKELYELLNPIYKEALSVPLEVSKDDKSSSEDAAYFERLPGHIMFMMMAYDLDIGSADNIAGQFIETATDRNLADAADYLSLYLGSDKLNPEFLRVILKYLDRRIEAIQKVTDGASVRNELSSFSSFLPSMHLSIDYKVKILDMIIDKKSKIKHYHDFFKFFSNLEGVDLDKLMPFLDVILAGPGMDYWEIAAYQDEIIATLEKGRLSKSPETVKIVAALRGKLSANGHTKIFTALTSNDSMVADNSKN